MPPTTGLEIKACIPDLRPASPRGLSRCSNGTGICPDAQLFKKQVSRHVPVRTLSVLAVIQYVRCTEKPLLQSCQKPYSSLAQILNQATIVHRAWFTLGVETDDELFAPISELRWNFVILH